MIKHIVFWKLADGVDGQDKKTNALRLKERLEALKSEIAEIKNLEVGLDFCRTDAAWDIALYSEFASRADLDTYQKHPKHMEVAALVNRLRSDRAVVDYEI